MEKARRYNKGKLRYELISNEGLKNLAEVYTKGVEKYTIYNEDSTIKEDGANNWKKGMSWTDTIASVKRHIQSWEAGEDFDELGTKHLANAAWGLFTILDYYKSYPQGDDRPQSYLTSLKIGLDIDGVLGDFDKHLCDTVGIDPHQIHHWNDPIVGKYYQEVKDNKDFWLTMPTLIEPSELPFEVHAYITSRSIDDAVTKEWLDTKGFPVADLYCVGHNESKVEVAKQSGIDIFVDDKFENFKELNNAGICCFLMDAPHNQKYNVGYKRIKSLTELFK